MNEAEVREVERTSADELRGRAPGPAALPRLEAAAGRLAGLLREGPSAVLTLTGNGAMPAGEHRVEVALDYRVGPETRTVSESVQVLVAATPRQPGWFSSDLHMHSYYSDGNTTIAGLKADLASQGYFIGYVTDHSGSLMSAGVFNSMSGPYPTDCKAASDTTTSMFPGAEVAVGHDTWLGWNGDGHILSYGISSTYGLDDDYWGPQTGLDKVSANNSPLSSPGIAHPTHLLYGWDDWSVLRYYGIELMSGYQWYFDINSGPASRWRSECQRLASHAGSFRPSVRSGSDYHSSWRSYVTYIKLPSDDAWYSGTWEDRWTAVSAALRDGRTTISRKGSMAYITADGFDVGSSFAGSGGSALSFSVFFNPIESGSYTLTLYQDNMAVTVWTQSASLAANTPYTWTESYTYPGGSHYYWLYVSGPDYAYTTPIYIHP